MMRNFIRAMLPILLFCSCSIQKKSITHLIANIDSTGFFRSDTVHKNQRQQTTTKLDLNDFDFVIDYDTTNKQHGTHDTIPGKKAISHTVVLSDPDAEALKEIVDALSANPRTAHIAIHIGDLSKTTDDVKTSDSTAGHTSDSVAVKRSTDQTTKNIFKMHAPLWLTIGAIIVLLLLVLYIIYRVKKSIL